MQGLVRIQPAGAADRGVDFDSPLEMLTECHGRVQAQCRTLARLAAHLVRHGSDRAAAEAASAVMRYFDRAAPDHHADEEADLFPALLDAMAGSDAVCIRDLIAALESQHREFERRWLALREPLQDIACGKPAQLDPAAVNEFQALYARHIALEDQELIPMAKRLLAEAALAAIGRSMRARRGERL